MLRQKYLGKMALLAGLSLSLGLADFGYCDTTSPSQSGSPSQAATPAQAANSNPSVITASNGYGYQNTTYDLSAALSRDAAAKSVLNSATVAYAQAAAQVRKDFRSSAEYRNPAKELDDAREAYTAAEQPVLAKLMDNADYHSLVESRTQLANALSKPNVTPEARIQLAEQKLSISDRISQIQSTALASDSTVQQAKARVITAQRALADLTSNFESSLYTLPGVVAAKQALDSAKTEFAAAEANLSGATIARNDLMNSDMRNPPPEASPYNNYLYSPYNYGFPYGVGYGGFPFGFSNQCQGGWGGITVTPGSGNIVHLMQEQTGRFFPGT